jgi:hypothetical protein
MNSKSNIYLGIFIIALPIISRIFGINIMENYFYNIGIFIVGTLVISNGNKYGIAGKYLNIIKSNYELQYLNKTDIDLDRLSNDYIDAKSKSVILEESLNNHYEKDYLKAFYCLLVLFLIYCTSNVVDFISVIHREPSAGIFFIFVVIEILLELVSCLSAFRSYKIENSKRKLLENELTEIKSISSNMKILLIKNDREVD